MLTAKLRHAYLVDMREIRMANLKALIDEAGSAAELARRVVTDSAYLSQLMTGVKTATGRKRSIGDDLARRLEGAMGKPHGWMDHSHANVSFASKAGMGVEADVEKPSSYPGPTGTFSRHSNIQPADPARDDHLPIRRIPVISHANAGFDRTAEDYLSVGDALEVVDYRGYCSEYTYGLYVKGESMWPEYFSGDIIVVDPQLQPQQGADVVVRNADTDEVTLKRFVDDDGRRYLKALNPNWPEPFRIVTEHDRFCGVVIDQRRPRRRLVSP